MGHPLSASCHIPWRRRSFAIAAALLACTLVGAARPAAAQPLAPEHALDMPLQLRYGPYVDAYVTARYLNDRYYVPLGELLHLLQIRIDLDLDHPRATGYLLEESRPYEIDFAARTATFGERQLALTDEDFLPGDLDLYVSPQVLASLFDLRFNADMSSLKLWLSSEKPLPVAVLHEREAERNRALGRTPGVQQAPLITPARQRLLGGGLLDYNLSFDYTPTGTFYNFDTRVGAQVLGGGLTWNARGGTSSPSILHNSELTWHYVHPSAGPVRQAKVGHQHASGISTLRFQGVTLTNEPYLPRTSFSTYPVEGHTEPGWDVELYVDNQLYEYQQADEAGRYVFHVPISYGTTNIQLKYYGPTGEMREERRRLDVPYTFLPRGGTRYTLHAGRHSTMADQGGLLVQSHGALGLTDYLTAKVGVDYVTGLNATRPVPYGALSARIGEHVLAHLESAPGSRSRVTLNTTFPSQLSFGVDYTRYGAQSFRRFDISQSELQANVFVPFRLGALPANLRLYTFRTVQNEYIRYRFQAGGTVYAGPARLSLNAQVYARDQEEQFGFERARLSPSASYRFTGRRGRLALLNDLFVTGEFDYDLHERAPTRLRLRFTRNVRRIGLFELSYDYLFQNRMPSLGFRFTIDLPHARSTTNASARTQGSSFSNRISGSAGIDWARRQPFFYNRPLVGRSATTLRLFVDGDGNGRYDEGEAVIDKPRLRLSNGSVVQRGASDVLTAVNMRPTVAQTAHIDPNSIKNPLWVPKHETFSFIPEPNTISAVDVPLFIAGIVEGTVLRNDNRQDIPVAGLKLYLRRGEDEKARTLTTFSDGTFMDFTLPPGTYEACIDSTHLARLGVVAEPAFQRFTIAQTADGDYISGLNFTLHPRDAEEAPAEAETDLFAGFDDWPADETTAALDSSSTVPAIDEDALFDAFFEAEADSLGLMLSGEGLLEEVPAAESALDEAHPDAASTHEGPLGETADAESTPDEAGTEEPFTPQQPLPGVYDLPSPQDTWPPTFRDWRDVYRHF